ncbi:MAG: OmpA family protein [Hyphomicrobiaceae bacterium]
MMLIARSGWRVLPAAMLVALPGVGQAQELPKWSLDAICRADSARAHCLVLERQALDAVSASWPFVPDGIRKRCIARQRAPEDHTWRVLATCLEGESDKEVWIATRSTPVDMKAYEEEVRARRAELEAEATERKRIAEEARRRVAEAEARREAEAAAKAKAEAEARRLAEEAEARRKAEAAAKQKAEAEARRLAEEAEARRKAEAAAKQKAEADVRRLAEEAEVRRKSAEAARLEAEAEARRRAEDDARRRAEAEELRRLQAEADARKRAEEDARRRAAEAEASRQAAEEARRRAAEAEARRNAAEAAERNAAQAEARRKAEEEARRAAAEADAQRKAEEAARRLAAEAETRQREAEAESRRAATRQADLCQQVMAKTAQRGVILFGHDDATLDAKSFPTLDQIARAAKVCTRLSITVDGHTNSLGTVQYNQGLSERRAAAVVQYLTGAGVDPAQLAARGYGKSRPVASNATAEGLARNRRIEFSVKPE